MDQGAQVEAPLIAPRGFHLGKVDGAGRIKLPAKFQEYIARTGSSDLFMTEFRGKARLFTNGSWQKLVALFDEDPDRQDRFTFRAEAIGGDVDIDPQGRLTIPVKLRAKLGLEDQQVQMRFHEDVITFYTITEFEETESKNAPSKEDDEAEALRKGTKLR